MLQSSGQSLSLCGTGWPLESCLTKTQDAVNQWIMDTKPLYEKMNRYFEKNKLKSTKQRDVIVDTFFKMEGKHVKIEELWDKVRKKNPNIGYATVYRTLMLLVDAKVANQRQFNDGQSCFEIVSQTHHDHLICTECRKIVEFENITIETIQKQIAKNFKFILTGHKMELYGMCEACAQNQASGSMSS